MNSFHQTLLSQVLRKLLWSMPTSSFRVLGCGSDEQCRAGAALKEFERFDKDNDGELDEKELHKMFDR